VKCFKKLAENKHACTVISAIRGPDLPNTAPLKYIFTSRIRFLALGLSSYLWSIRTHSTVHYEAILDALTLDYSMLSHYLIHISNALDSLFKLGLMDAREHGFLSELASILKQLTHIDEGMYSEEDTVKYTGEVIKSVEWLLSEYGEFIVEEEVL